MSLGNLQNEGDLRRLLEKELQRPGVLPPPSLPFKNLKFGSVEVEWTEKGIASASKTVTHELGSAPEGLAAIGPMAGSYAEYSEPGATTFKLRLVSTTGEVEKGIKRTVYWIAVC